MVFKNPSITQVYRKLFKNTSRNASMPQHNRHGDSPGGAVVRIHLPMQGTQVRALVWEDPTCHGATKPVCHNY